MRQRSRGILVLAQNSAEIDYAHQARILARSIHATQTQPIGVSVVVDHDVDPGADFEHVIRLPADDAAGEPWKIHNKWRLWELSPYRETLWLDSDMIVPIDLGRWWPELASYPIRFCSRPVDFTGRAIVRHVYRKRWVERELPMLYTGLVYFDRSAQAREIFDMAKHVMREWPEIAKEHSLGRWKVSGDRAFSLAVKLLGYHWAVPEIDDFFRFVHMKPHTFQSPRPIDHDWTLSSPLTIDRGRVRIGGFSQRYPVHYVRKELVDRFESAYAAPRPLVSAHQAKVL